MTYKILHSYKDEILIPILAIKNNVEFLFDKDVRKAITRDGVVSEITSWKFVNILSEEARKLIKMIYDIDDVYAFMMRWYKSHKYINSMEFIYMKLKKEEQSCKR